MPVQAAVPQSPATPSAGAPPPSVGVEPFEASYGAGFEAQEDVPNAVECEIVEDGGQLRFHEAAPGAEQPRRLCFVDGVMRTEARLTRSGPDGETRMGIAGSWAAGAVLAEADRPARIEEVRQGRAIVFAGGERVELPARPGGWQWTPLAVEGEDVDAARQQLKETMQGAEARIAERLCADGWVTVFDGPLGPARRRGRNAAAASGRGQVLGYVKTHHRRMLALESWRLVPRLGVGQRTSLFATKVGLYACYLRVGGAGPWAGGWAGIARLETPQDEGLASAVDAVGRAAAWLPRFATRLHREARAPVNLAPVSGLERKLRRLLGNPGLAVRAVRESVMELNRSVERA